MLSIYLVIAVVCFFGAIMQASIGFGFPIIAIIFFSMVLPVPTAVSIVQAAGIVGVGYIFFKYFRSVKWKTLIPFLVFALGVGTACTWISGDLPVSRFKLWMGVMLSLLAVYMLFYASRVKIKGTPLMGSAMGIVSGAMNGFFAIGGPPVALYLLPTTDDKFAYLATANAYFFIFKVFNLPVRFMNGSVTREHYGYLAASIFFMTVGTIVGEKLMLKVNRKLLEKLVYGFVLISGLIIVAQELF